MSQNYYYHSTKKKYFELNKSEYIDELINKNCIENESFEKIELIMETFSLSLNNNWNYINYQMKFNTVVIDDHKLERDNTINLLKNVLSFLKINDFAILEGSDGIDLLNLIRLDKKRKLNIFS